LQFFNRPDKGAEFDHGSHLEGIEMTTCARCVPAFDRRNFLRFSLGAGAGLAAAALPHRLQAQQTVAKQASGRTAKAVIMLFMGGGPSQFETFDPKPGHPNAGEFKAIDTTLRGVKFSEYMVECAKAARHMSLVRSVVTHEGAHDRAYSLMHIGIQPIQGLEMPAVGTVVSYEKGGKDFPLPHYISMGAPYYSGIPQATVFGEQYLPFKLNGPDNPIPNLRSAVGQSRDRARAALLLEQDKAWSEQRRQKEVAKVSAAYVQSEEVMNTPLLKAFNCQEEPSALRQRYGSGAFGTNCLLARRLVQAGCSFVEIGYGNWDHHTDNCANLKGMLPEMDRAMGTLIQDLAEKDLLSETLVYWCGEFGRTPTVNGAKGRDHHADGFTVAMAGGGLAPGRVYGDTGPGGQACNKPVPIHNLFATIYKACGIDPDRKYETEGRKIKYASINGNASSTARPVVELF